MAALPATAPARPKQPRKVLVLGKAAGFVHSSIPLAGRTVEELGKKTGAWATTITYDPADINEQNLKQDRRDLPRQHDRRVPGRCERRGGDGSPAEGAARLRARRQGPRREFTPPPTPTIRTHRRRVNRLPRRRLARPGGRAGGRRRRGGVGGGRGGAGPSSRSSWRRPTRQRSEVEPATSSSALADAGTASSIRRAPAASPRPSSDSVSSAPCCRCPQCLRCRRLDLRPAASGLHRLLQPAGVHAARPGQPGRQLAGVQQDDWRVLQVALEQSAGDHLQD